MIFPFVAVSAVVPSILILWYFYARDLNPEPKKVLAATFGLGALITIPVLVVAFTTEHFLHLPKHSPLLAAFLDALLLAAVPEELFKFAVLAGYAAKHQAFDEPMDGVVYGVVASLGFATLENVLYSATGGLSTAIVRAVTAVPGHAFMGAIMGYFVGQAVLGPKEKRGAAWVLAIGWPILLHALYDFPLLSLDRLAPDGKAAASGHTGLILGLMLITIAVLIFEWRWSMRLVRRLHADQVALAAVPPAAVPVVATLTGLDPVPTAVGSPTGLDPGAPLRTPAAPLSVRSTPTKPSNVVAWLLILPGGAVASWGGLFLLGIGLAFLMGSVEKGEIVYALIGTALIGGLPFAVGMLMFVAGIRRLGRSQPEVASRTDAAGH